VIDSITGKFTEPNSNACKLYGLASDELIKKGPADLSPDTQPNSRPSGEALQEKIADALQGNSPVFDWRIKDSQGRLIPCEFHLSRLPGEHPMVRATIVDITERKKAEEEIAKFKMGIERSADAVFMTDRDGIIVYINPAFTSVYGYSAQDAIGNNPRIIQSGLLPKEAYEQFWGTLLSKNTISGEIINRAKDGRIVTIVGTNSPILDEAGNIQGFMAVHHDISSAKLAEDALRNSEAELRALFAAMKDVVIVYDKDGRYIKIAPTDPTLLVKPPELLIGKTLYDVFSATDADRLKENIQAVLRTGAPHQVEYSLQINNQTFWFVGVISPMQQDTVVWVARDITESKKAEETLRQNDETLRRQNEYLATAAEVSRLVTSTLDLDTLFNRTVDLIKSRFAYYFVSIFTLDDSGFNAVLREGTGPVGQEMKNRKHSLPVGSKSIIGAVTSSRKTIIVNNTALDPTHRPNPLLPDTRAEAGIPLKIGSRILGSLDIQSKEINAFQPDDIAILETLADQIAVALDNANSYDLAQKAVIEMRELDKIKSQFLANMSHELRTPLNSIIGFSRVILKGIDGPTTEQQHQDLSAIYNSGQHLLGLINDILDLSKIDAGKMELTLEELNIVDTIKSVLATTVGLVKDKPVKLLSELDATLPTVRADPMRIRQILLNLISNASKFTEEGTVTVTAEVQPSSNGQKEMVISIIDTGPGISIEDQSKLFLAFSQVDSSPTRKTGGTGLGLSICQRLVDLHGGKIGVHSSVGKGSTFYFTLPLFQLAKPT
jgi:PAS domain S-box-containing protein